MASRVVFRTLGALSSHDLARWLLRHEDQPVLVGAGDIAAVSLRSDGYIELEYSEWLEMAGTEEDMYASRRLVRIADAIGEDAVNEIVCQEKDNARRRLGDRYWHIFTHGTPEEWEQVAYEVLEQINKSDHVLGYTVSDLQRLAVARFPETPGASLAKAMRMAAAQVEKGEVESPSCDHLWEQQGEQYCITSWTEQCPKCDALRQREVSRPMDNSQPT